MRLGRRRSQRIVHRQRPGRDVAVTSCGSSSTTPSRRPPRADLQRPAERAARPRRAPAARRAAAARARASSAKRCATSPPAPPQSTLQRALAARRASSTAPTSRRSEAALPPTATARVDRRRLERPRARRAACVADGVELRGRRRVGRAGSASASDAGADAERRRTTSTPPASVPIAISVEPPPTSTTRDARPAAASPSVRVAPRNASRASSSPSSTRPRRRRARASPRRTRRGWRRSRIAAVATDADSLRAELARRCARCSATTRATSAIFSRGDLRRPQPVPEAGEGALLQHLVQPPVRARRRPARASCSCRCRCRRRASAYGDVAMMERDRCAAIEVHGLRKAYDDARGRARHRLQRRAAARCSGCSGPTAPARRPPSRSSRATATRTRRRRVACSATTPASAPRRCARGSGSCCRAAGIYPHLTVRETVAHWASLLPARRATSSEVIALVGLDESADQRARTLSGGQQRRLDLALALVGDPELVFLDEPTTGFDPAARRAAWDTVRVAARPRQDRAADDALPRRGAGAGRPRGDHQGRPDPRRGPAGRARRRRRALPRRLARAPTAASERETDDPTALLHELTGDGAGARRAARGAERHAAEPRGRLPGADR